MFRRLFGRGGPAEGTPTSEGTGIDAREAARRALMAYHRRTSHGFGRYAAGPMDLDWANQPAPFRRWAGAEVLALAHFAQDPAEAGREAGPGSTPPPTYGVLFGAPPLRPAPLGLESLARFLFDGASLSAAKSYGDARWFLRVPPSSGNLHPTELHLVLPPLDGGGRGSVAHYDPREHILERRALLDAERTEALFGRAAPGSFYVGLSAIAWREAWKYGERAFRYVQHDTGHMLACLDVAAALSGWDTSLEDCLGAQTLSALLGLSGQDGPEAELPQVLLGVRPAGADVAPVPADGPAPAFVGLPTPLSAEHIEWDAVELAERLSRAPDGGVREAGPPAPLPPEGGAAAQSEAALALRTLVRRRRSALGYDRRGSLQAQTWFDGLERLVPRPGRRPFALWPHTPRVHPVFFVHAVVGLEPGIYLLGRSDGARERLAPAFAAAGARGPALWEPVPGAPRSLPLWCLARGDVRSLAAELACGQAIAGDGVYAAALLGELGSALDALGPPGYRRLHWEAGLVGQAMYLGAEAQGLVGTGIGCFFDGETSRALGLVGERLVSIYHFAVGHAVHDGRLETGAPYAEPVAPV
ncbi:MAG: hypothetical protein GC161_08110 [Planctomycetaceae bacterium]|nr:hypothetical protein [Planctomycetaceae bacterium]